MKLEITYIYEGQESWTYFESGTDDFGKSIKKATTHFKKFCTANGFGTRAKLKQIQYLPKLNDKPAVINVEPPDRTPSKRTRKPRNPKK